MGSLDSFPVLRIHPQNKGVMAARQSPDKDLYLITVVGCYMILCGSSVCNGDQGAPPSVKHQVIPIAINTKCASWALPPHTAMPWLQKKPVHHCGYGSNEKYITSNASCIGQTLAPEKDRISGIETLRMPFTYQPCPSQRFQTPLVWILDSSPSSRRRL